MPPCREKLSDAQIDTLAAYVVDPANTPNGKDLFQQNCKSCHGDRVPQATEFAKAKEIIASGGAHQTMPVWGTVLTAQQLDALVDYTLSAAKGTPLEVGQNLYADNCASCHGRRALPRLHQLGQSRAQARVHLPWDELRGKTWRLDDALSGEVYERSGDEIRIPEFKQPRQCGHCGCIYQLTWALKIGAHKIGA